jgi:modulator of FtsH protease HflK
MKRWLGVLAIVLLGYAATGLYVVRGNEQALVQRFGKALPALSTAGLHLDLPWPWVQIRRVNIHELRTISVGIMALEPFDGAGFIRDPGLDRQAEFLTGDKNILNLQVNLHYRIVDPRQYYFGSQSPEIGLKLLAESQVTGTVSQCSVDYVHPLGLNELRAELLRVIRVGVDHQPWGLAVDDVTIVGLPPVEVKAAFLDVSNARAERDQLISRELSLGEKQRAAAEANARQMIDRAESTRLARIESARGAADRFQKIVNQFVQEAADSGTPISEVRHAAMQRIWSMALEELLPRLSRQVLIDPQQPVDLFLWQQNRQPAQKPGTELNLPARQ